MGLNINHVVLAKIEHRRRKNVFRLKVDRIGGMHSIFRAHHRHFLDFGRGYDPSGLRYHLKQVDAVPLYRKNTVPGISDHGDAEVFQHDVDYRFLDVPRAGDSGCDIVLNLEERATLYLEFPDDRKIDTSRLVYGISYIVVRG